MRILLVEDDPQLGAALQEGLIRAGMTTDWLASGEAADQALHEDDFAAVILDLGLPKLPGQTVLARLRARGNTVPVLVLTARDALPDKVSALDQGADDYLVKPVDVEELAARIRALIRRAGGRADPVIRVGAIALDPARRSVLRAGQTVELSVREFAIAHLLLENAGRVVSRRQLESALYGWSEGVESNAIEVHIHHLRRKLGNDAIRTVRGVGYMAVRPATDGCE